MNSIHTLHRSDKGGDRANSTAKAPTVRRDEFLLTANKIDQHTKNLRVFAQRATALIRHTKIKKCVIAGLKQKD